MSTYPVIVFLHIVGALGLFIGLGIEWLCVDRLGRVETTDRAREWTDRIMSLRRLLGPSMAVLLVTGIYMLATVWGHVWWAAIGLVGMILMAVVDAVVARGAARSLAHAVRATTGPVTPQLGGQLRNERLRISIEMRLAIALGIVFLMSVKPGLTGSVVTLATAAVLGPVVRGPVWQRAAAAAPAPPCNAD